MRHKKLLFVALPLLAIGVAAADGCVNPLTVAPLRELDGGPIDLDSALPDATSTPDTGADAGTTTDAATDAGAHDAGAHDAGGEAGASGLLWVTDNFAATTPSVLAFSLAAAATGGGVAPTTTIGGALTTLTGPGCVAFDGSGNLWVVNSLGSKQAGQIVEFAAAGVAAGGNIAPIVTISGANTTLGNPSGCAFDSSGALWVTNIDPSVAEANNVVAFSATQLATGGNIAPAISLGGALTQLCNTIDLTFDSAGNLWVANLCGPLEEFVKADLAAGGNVAPVVHFGQATGVNGIAFDADGNLWSSLQGGVNAVTEFTAASLAAAAVDGGNAVAALQISGATTQMNMPFGVAFANGNLWVVQQGTSTLTQFTVTSLAAGANDVAPLAVVSDGGTMLSSPSFIGFH